jgi:hypothetical protein
VTDDVGEELGEAQAELDERELAGRRERGYGIPRAGNAIFICRRW